MPGRFKFGIGSKLKLNSLERETGDWIGMAAVSLLSDLYELYARLIFPIAVLR